MIVTFCILAGLFCFMFGFILGTEYGISLWKPIAMDLRKECAHWYDVAKRLGGNVTEIRDYVLVIEYGDWARGDVRTGFRRVRAYDAADARDQFVCRSFCGTDSKGKMKPSEVLRAVVPYEPSVHGEQSIERHVRARAEL